MKHLWKRSSAAMLAACLLAGSIVPAYAADETEKTLVIQDQLAETNPGDTTGSVTDNTTGTPDDTATPGESTGGDATETPGDTTTPGESTGGDTTETPTTPETPTEPEQPAEPDGTTSGTINETISWTLDKDGVLTLSGTGEIPSKSVQDQYKDSIWDKERVVKVVVGDGITTIGTSAFEDGYPNLKEVVLSETVTNIQSSAFYNCTALETVSAPAQDLHLGEDCFYHDSSEDEGYSYPIDAQYTVGWGSELHLWAFENEMTYTTVGEKQEDEISLSVNNQKTGIKLAWNGSETIAYDYMILRATQNSDYQVIDVVEHAWADDGTSDAHDYRQAYTYTDTGRTNGVKYTYCVVGIIGEEDDDMSVSNEAMMYRLKRSNITRISNTSSRRATVSWYKNTKGSGYQVQACQSEDFTGSTKKSYSIYGYGNTSKTFTGLTKGKTYYFRVRAYKKIGGKTYYSKWSDVQTKYIAK